MTKKNKIYCFIIFLIFVVLTLFLSFYHENWRDEVQAYLLCRDMSFLELLKNIRYEGHPFFYYLILYPFVKLGVGMKVVNIFSLLFIYISAWLLLFKTELNTWNKAFILFSYPFFFEYAIIGRSYSLIILLIFLIAILYKDRKKNAVFIGILCGLLLNTHLLVSGFVLAIFIFFYLYELLFNRRNNSLDDNKKIFLGFVIICFSGILLVIQFLPILFNGIAMSTNKNFSFPVIMRNIYMFLFCFNNFNGFFIFLLLVFFVVYFIFVYKESKVVFISLIFNIVYYAIFCAFLWGAVQSHVIYLLIIFIFYYAIINYNKSSFILFIIFIFSVGSSVKFYFLDYKYDFSLAGDAYKYISKKIDKKDLIVTVDDDLSESILGYDNNYRFYDLSSKRYFSYVIWDEKRENTKIDFSYLDRSIVDGRNVYFILAHNDKVCKSGSYVLKQLSDKYNVNELFNNSNKISLVNEKYVIYEILEK